MASRPAAGVSERCKNCSAPAASRPSPARPPDQARPHPGNPLIMPDQPTVTVIVLNYNGLRHLEDCFNSLLAVDYPADQLALMLVDNASQDGSTAFMREHFPRVVVAESPTNLGFAGGNNLGARASASQYVIFLNNDMRVDPQFVRGLVAAVQGGAEPGAAGLANASRVCAGAKILNWD